MQLACHRRRIERLWRRKVLWGLGPLRVHAPSKQEGSDPCVGGRSSTGAKLLQNARFQWRVVKTMIGLGGLGLIKLLKRYCWISSQLLLKSKWFCITSTVHKWWNTFYLFSSFYLLHIYLKIFILNDVAFIYWLMK